MKHKFTPGPWHVKIERHESLLILSPHRDRAITSFTLYQSDVDVVKANARLIAAAPELLDQLVAHVNALKDYSQRLREAGHRNIVNDFSYVDTLIAKATGGEK